MESIIVEIVLGNNDEIVEFMLPAHIPLDSLVPDIVRLIEQVKLQITFDKECVVLFDVEQEFTLKPEWTLAQNGVKDGSRLIIL